MPSRLHNRLSKLERKIAPGEPPKFVKIIAQGEDVEEVCAEAEAKGFSRDNVMIIMLRGVPVPDHIKNAR